MAQQKINSTASNWHYGVPAIALHWIIAALVIFLLGLGWYMMSIEKQPGARSLFDLHKSLGMTVMLFIVLRIIWRATHKPEGLPMSVPVWQAKISTFIHWALYACMIIMPVTGYIGAAHQKKSPQFFGLDTPAWATPNHDLAEQLFSVHSFTAWVLVVLMGLHVLAALKHLFINKDQIFQRMWFNR